ncbi:MAG: hypothetical protein KF773_27220 [Deltaproteobacteria bacterium]|nr:hypothetical protein [Deltaproteobacteria bacterium]
MRSRGAPDAAGVVMSSMRLVALAAGLSTGCGGGGSKAEALAAWNEVYSVLVSPRCLNCHTARRSRAMTAAATSRT